MIVAFFEHIKFKLVDTVSSFIVNGKWRRISSGRTGMPLYEMAWPKPRPVPSEMELQMADLRFSFCSFLFNAQVWALEVCVILGNSIHSRAKAVYIQSIIQLKAARISTVGCATFCVGAGSEFDSQSPEFLVSTFFLSVCPIVPLIPV